MTEFGTAGKGELMAGYTMTSKEGLRIGGTLILSGNADTSDVLSGKEFYTNDPKTKKRGTLALSGSATAADVLTGKTFYNTDAKSKQGGQMADNGDWGTTLAPGGAIAVPPGKHSGNGVVRARGVVFSDFSSIIRSAAQGFAPGKTDIGADKYILGITNADMHHYPGDGTSDPGEMWAIWLENSHTIGVSTNNGTHPYITYNYVQL